MVFNAINSKSPFKFSSLILVYAWSNIKWYYYQQRILIIFVLLCLFYISAIHFYWKLHCMLLFSNECSILYCCIIHNVKWHFFPLAERHIYNNEFRRLQDCYLRGMPSIQQTQVAFVVLFIIICHRHHHCLHHHHHCYHHHHCHNHHYHQILFHNIF